MNDDRTGYVQRSIDRQINDLRAQGKTIIRIEMTKGAQDMLRRRYFPDANVPDYSQGGGIFRYRGFPVKTARLDVPAVVYGEREGEV